MSRSRPPLQYELCNVAWRRGAGLLTLLLAAALALAANTRAAGPETRVPVTLFGQPCVLKGPLDEKTLKAVHAISPEQIAPPFTSSRTREQTRRAIEHLRETTGLPSGLDRYRDQLGSELKAQLAFLEGLESARRAGNGSPLVTAAKAYVKPSREKEFEALAAKFPARGSQQATVLEQLFDFYSDAWQTDAPEGSEEEFHRAIRKLGIQYVCNFDSGDDSGGSEDDGGKQ